MHKRIVISFFLSWTMGGKKSYCFFGADLDFNRPLGNWIDQVLGLYAVSSFSFLLLFLRSERFGLITAIDFKFDIKPSFKCRVSNLLGPLSLVSVSFQVISAII